MKRIYLDSNATTSLDPRVFKAMLSDLSGLPANPSSSHWFGQQARARLNVARATVASYFKAKPEHIIFTSGGTEGVNLLLRGLKRGHIITTAIEHSSVYRTIQALESETCPITYVPVTLWGAPLPELIAAAIRSDTVAIMLTGCNGETGVKIDLEAIGQIAEQRQVPLLLDLVSYAGKEPLHLPSSVKAAIISGHKIHAPKGIGALYLHSDLKHHAVFTGGNQEYKKRPGTENLSGILGLAEAIKIVQEEQTTITDQLRDLRDHLELGLLRALPDISINGQGPRIANTSNLNIAGVDGETLLMQLDLAGIAVSHGSACTSAAMEPSRVLTQMGMDNKTARSSIRLSVSRFNTREEIDSAIATITHTVEKIRKL